MIDYFGQRELILRACYFAVDAHAAVGQKRQYTGQPYIVHPAAVATMVWNATKDHNITAAAYLHDVVEDTKATLEILMQEFGPEITALVEQVTDVSKPEDGNRATRKELDRMHLAKASPGGKTIKLADLIDNSESILRYDPNFAKVYLREKAALLKVLQEGNADLFKKATDIVITARAKLTGQTT